MTDTEDDGFGLTRRTVLQASGATAAMASLSGCLSWLDTDDSPVASVAAADTAYGNCWMCHHACGQELAVKDETVIDITGVDGHPRASAGPETEGTLCPKGLAEMEKAHDPDRITEPHIRRDGELEQVSWDEAFEYTAQRLEAFDDEHGAETLLNAASWATTDLHEIIWGNLYGTPERIGRGRHVCFGGPHLTGGLMGVGTDMRFVDYQNADYIIAWGRNIFESFAANGNPKASSKRLTREPRSSLLTHSTRRLRKKPIRGFQSNRVRTERSRLQWATLLSKKNCTTRSSSRSGRMGSTSIVRKSLRRPQNGQRKKPAWTLK